MKRFLLAYARLLTVLLLVLGLAGVSFGHDLDRPQDDAALAAYVAAGGSLDDICNGTGPDHGTADCEACLIQGAAWLAGPDCAGEAVFLAATRVAQMPEAAPPHRAAFDFSHAGRAPPRV